jgi:hypothetical protein
VRAAHAYAQAIHVLALEPSLRLIRKYDGHVQKRFLVRSGFGAAKDRFIISGSEGE